MNDKMRAMETMSLFEKAVYGLKMLHWVLPVWKHLRISTEKGLKRYFNSRGIQNLFCSEETFMSVVMPIGWAFTGDFRAPPKGGSQAFISWLCKNIESAGSKIFLNHPVKKVLLNDRDNAIGVLLEKGNSINSRYVLAACDVQTLYDEMVPGERIPEQLRKVLRDADLYYSNFSIFIGLDCDTTSLGFNEEVLCLTRDDVSQKDHSGGDPHKTSLIIIAPSVRDPSLAPKGKGMITIHCPAYMDYEDNWKTDEGLKRGEAYRILKREFADILIDRVENTFAPGLRKHIEVMEIATPVTYWRYTGNRKGSIMGASPTNKNIRAKLAHYRTPIKNLLLAGHWAEYGGGVPIAMRAGTNTSLMVLKDMNRAEYEKLKTVMDGKG
jgi:prolycopene isomerase